MANLKNSIELVLLEEADLNDIRTADHAPCSQHGARQNGNFIQTHAPSNVYLEKR